MALVIVVILALVVSVLLLQRLRSNGVTVLWSQPTESLYPRAVAAGPVAIATEDGVLRGLDPVTGTQRWRLDGEWRDVVVAEGRVLASTSGAGGETALESIAPADGQVQWRVARGNADRDIPITFAPATVVGDQVIVSTNDDEVLAVAAGTGEVQWATSARVFGSPVVAGDVVAVPGIGRAVGIDLGTGRVRWTLHAGPALELHPPAVLGDTFVFTSAVTDPAGESNARARVTAVDAGTGSRVWEYRTDAVELTAPVAVAGLVATGVAESYDGNDSGVLAFDGSGDEPVWTASDLGDVAEPVASASGLYVQPVSSDAVVALDPATGGRRWQYEFDEIGEGPMAVGDNVIWAAGDADELVGLDAGSGEQLTGFRAAGAITTLTLGPGRAYVGTYGDGLFALDTS